MLDICAEAANCLPVALARYLQLRGLNEIILQRSELGFLGLFATT